MNKPRFIILLFGNRYIYALVLLLTVFIAIVWWESQQFLLPFLAMLLLSVYSMRANKQVVAYLNYKHAWDAAGNEDTVNASEKSRNVKPVRKRQIVAGVLLCGFLGFFLLDFPRDNDPRTYDVVLLAFITLTLWLGYLLLRFRTQQLNTKLNNKQQDNYIVNHCQPVPKAAATATKISQQLPDYCKTLLQHKL